MSMFLAVVLPLALIALVVGSVLLGMAIEAQSRQPPRRPPVVRRRGRDVANVIDLRSRHGRWVPDDGADGEG